jgi:hypothetical protein
MVIRESFVAARGLTDPPQRFFLSERPPGSKAPPPGRVFRSSSDRIPDQNSAATSACEPASEHLASIALPCASSPLASAALIFSISSSADSREISIATRSRPPSASQTKSTHSA